jgi:hypothetical protein
MKYYIFKTFKKSNTEVREFKQILGHENEYISYNKYLQENYGTDIEENEDYIPFKNKDVTLMILKEGYFETTDLEDVFEILLNELYKKEGVKCEENYCSQRLS